MRSHLLIVNLRTCSFVVLSRKLSPVTMNLRLFPTFSSIMFNVSGFMLIFWVFTGWMIRIYLHCSLHWHLVRLAPFAEDVSCSLYASLTYGEVLSITETWYTMFSWYSQETCLFMDGNARGGDWVSRGGCEGMWERNKEETMWETLWPGCKRNRWI